MAPYFFWRPHWSRVVYNLVSSEQCYSIGVVVETLFEAHKKVFFCQATDVTKARLPHSMRQVRTILLIMPSAEASLVTLGAQIYQHSIHHVQCWQPSIHGRRALSPRPPAAKGRYKCQEGSRSFHLDCSPSGDRDCVPFTRVLTSKLHTCHGQAMAAQATPT